MAQHLDGCRPVHTFVWLDALTVKVREGGRTVAWSGGTHPEVDLSGSGLRGLALRGPSSRTLRLPPTVRQVEITATTGAITVRASTTAAGQGRLVLDTAAPHVAVPSGLSAVRDVLLDGDGVISAELLTAVPDLEQLQVRWRTPPGTLTGDRHPGHTAPAAAGPPHRRLRPRPGRATGPAGPVQPDRRRAAPFHRRGRWGHATAAPQSG